MVRADHYRRVIQVIGGFTAVYVLVFIYMLVFKPVTKDQYQAFMNLYQAIPPLFAGVTGVFLAWRATNLRRIYRACWFSIGLACLSFAGGQLAWYYYETVRGIEVPFPGPPDIGYLGMVPLMFAGVLVLVSSDKAAGRARQFMDSAIVVSSFASLSWYFMIQKLWDPETDLLGRIIGVAYPLGDIAIMFVAMAAIMSTSADRVMKRAVALVAAGIVLVAFSDTAFTFLTLQEKYETGSPFDWGWPFGWLTIAWACLSVFWSRHSVSQKADDSVTKLEKPWVLALRVYGPYLAVVVSILVVVIHDLRTSGRINLQQHGEMLALIGLVLVRQIFMVLENVKLTALVKSMNDGLESVVQARTRQLTSLQELSKAVNSTLELGTVLDAALRETEAALQSNGAAVWLHDMDAGTLSGEVCKLRGLAVDDPVVKFISRLNFYEPAIQASFCPEGGEGPTYVLAAQVTLQGESRGVVAVMKQGEEFKKDDFPLMESIGRELGTALRNAEQHAIAVDAADHDSVTELLNHRAFQQRMEKLLQNALATETSLSVMVTDLDNFKLFNDTYGHLVGDEVLRTVARAISSTVPEDAVVARFGGDEFVVALPGIDVDSAQFMAKMIADVLTTEGYKHGNDDRVVPIGISIGIATAPVDGRNRHELLTVADRNLYEAKVSGRGIAATTDEQLANRALKAYGSFETLDALVSAVDNKDRYTRKHSEEVTEYSLWIAEEIGLSEETMKQLRIAGLLHDVGKIGVPDEILRKPGRLTPEEFEIMQRHPRLGELIVGAIPGMHDIVDGVRCHHERWDGQGYPDQLRGADIPLFGRILAVADAFSAMTTDRPYRAGMDWRTAMQQIQSGMSSQFDPEMAATFLKAVKKHAPERILEEPAA